MSRFLLEPCNNTLSHVGKCLAVREVLLARNHEVFLAVSPARAAFLDRFGVSDYFVLPDVQESDGGTAPSFSWFRPERVRHCVRAELDLLRRLRPDRVLGVFRFTGALSAALADVPYDSLVCGSMTPACPDVLGFDDGEAGAREQQAFLQFFRQTCAQRMRPAMRDLGLEPVDDVWQLLVGQRTLLWDFPEFQQLQPAPSYHHVGPVHWTGWPRPRGVDDALDRLVGPVAYLAFGTGFVQPRLIRHLVDVLWRMGYSIALALGGQMLAAGLPADPSRLATFDFLPVEDVLPRARVVVCHGGQGLIFDAMRRCIPVFVLPLQLEQAHNGVCVERMGCGRRLVRGVVYGGQADFGADMFLERPVEEVVDEMQGVLADPATSSHLSRAGAAVRSYTGVVALADRLEEGV